VRPTLSIGNKNYSSWSLRPWLALRWAGIAFDERLIPLGGEGYGKSKIPAVLAVSPSGRVPAMQLGNETIYDSLAIGEWAAEQPGARLWPSDPMRRAIGRSAVAEMHSGFAAVRRDLSMNIRRRVPSRSWPEDTTADITRLGELWTGLRTRFSADGPWLLGERSLADAFFAPVATRFRTYGVTPPPLAAAWCETLLADADFRAWEADALAEKWALPQTDALYA
jgi:glutathione S-transferase